MQSKEPVIGNYIRLFLPHMPTTRFTVWGAIIMKQKNNAIKLRTLRMRYANVFSNQIELMTCNGPIYYDLVTSFLIPLLMVRKSWGVAFFPLHTTRIHFANEIQKKLAHATKIIEWLDHLFFLMNEYFE